jgi:hypothetical protein
MVKHILIILTIILILAVFGACSSKQDVYISDTGEGKLSLDINLDGIVVRYAQDLMGGFSNSEITTTRLFDVNKILFTILNLESVNPVAINSDSADSLHLEIGFSDPGMIFDNSENPGIPRLISFSPAGKNSSGKNKLQLYLSRKNFDSVTELVGLKDSEIIDTFGPQDDPYTEFEYLDLMEFLFEEYESPETIRAIIKSSEIVINLVVDGEISSLSSGSFSGSVAEITIPLIDIVTLEEPIEITIEWK